MPELPEVETVKRGLKKLIIGRLIKTASTDNPKSFPNPINDVNAFLINASVVDVRRRAKVLMIDLSTKYTLVIHLKMTGQLVFVKENKGARDREIGNREFQSSESKNLIPISQPLIPASETRFAGGHPNNSLVDGLPDKSTRVIIEFDDGSHLYFNDQRKFGWVRLMPTVEVPNLPFMMKVGPEPLEPDFTVEQFTNRLQRRSRSNVKAVILDQSVIAGVGNIYADESLWGAMIHPSTLVGDLSPANIAALYSDIRYIMNLSIEKGGSTNRNYVDAEGKKGSFMDFARVFRREGLLCPRCNTEIIKLRVAGRGTHICPNCQVLGMGLGIGK